MKAEKKGLFITFEGIDGCGKSTQLELFKGFLKKKGIDFLIIREPGGTEIGERIRDILLDKNNMKMDSRTELLLFEASRSQIINEKILPALADGKTVICDRFFDSTTAYQGYGRGLDVKVIEKLNKYASYSRNPDITFLFDIDPEDAFNRIANRAKADDRIDSESVVFMKKVRDGYIKIANENPERIRIIDSNRKIETISEEIINIFEEVYG